jgi:CO dehydrogenase nickel-insertion accessory protein CooC1
MQRIDEHLSPANKASPAAFLSLCGNGGSGKTQIAMEYAWRQHSNGLDAVLWVRAESSMSVTQAVNDIAVTHLRFSKAKSAPGAYAVNSALVREWLRTTCESSGT